MTNEETSKGVSLDRVINKNILKVISESSYKCNICHCIMLNPHDCEKCNQAFCFLCIVNSKCPKNCTNSRIQPCSKGIRTMLSKIKFKCRNEECKKEIPYNDIQNHDLLCEFNRVKCPNPNCNLIFFKKNIEIHVKDECSFTLYKCKNCRGEYNREEYNKHLEECSKIKNKYLFVVDEVEEERHQSLPPVEIKRKSLEVRKMEMLEKEIKIKIEEIKNNFESFFKKSSEIVQLVDEGVQDFSINNDKNDKPKKENFNNLSKNNVELSITVRSLFFIKLLSRLKESLVIIFKQNLPKILLNNTLQIDEDLKGKVILFEENLKNLISDFKKKLDDEIKAKIISIRKNNENANDDSKVIISDMIKDLTEFDPNIEFDKILKLIEIKSNNEEFKNEFTQISTKLLKNLNKNFIELFEEGILNLSDILEKNFQNIEKEKGFKVNSNTESIEQINSQCNFILKNLKEISQILNEELGELSSEINDEFNLIEIIPLIKEFIKPNDNSVENLKISRKSFDSQKFNIILDGILKNTNLSKLIEKSSSTKIMNEIETLSDNANEFKEKNNQEWNKLIETLAKIDIKKLDISPLETILNSKLEQQINVTTIPNRELVSNGKIVNSDLSTLESDLDKIFEEKISKTEQIINYSINLQVSDVYGLKWCNQCKSIDYNFGFIKCSICSLENCKNCTSLCLGCTKLYCIYCNKCDKCNLLYCKNCRKSCLVCKKNGDLCENCIGKCCYCKIELCKDCGKTCNSCKTLVCEKCSKFCSICSKCACGRCDSFQNFKNCFTCKNIICNECNVSCSSCNMDLCTACYFKCRECRKILCKRCKDDCYLCETSFCSSCVKEKFSFNQCNFCQKLSCFNCVSLMKKCTKCSNVNCKLCCSICKGCREMFCNNCNINCDNCNEFSCSRCLNTCICDDYIFCDTCLRGTESISNHECLNFLNEAPSFSGIKTRSISVFKNNSEAKFYLEKLESPNLLIGLTDNNSFTSDSATFIDNIWCLKVKTGEKYSSKDSLQPFLARGLKKKNYLHVALKNNILYFRMNGEEAIQAFTLDNSNYYLYIENDTPMLPTRVVLVYMRKI